MPHPTIVPTPAARSACLDRATLFQDPRLETPPTRSEPPAERRRYEQLRREATAICGGCPVSVRCLYAAVVDHDVAGIAGGTTARERQAVRARLRLTVAADDLDTAAGVTARHRQVNPEQVRRMRRAHPDETLETLARRLGCSLSTVKRHLKRARADIPTATTDPAGPVRRPPLAAVLTALVAVRAGRRPAPENGRDRLAA